MNQITLREPGHFVLDTDIEAPGNPLAGEVLVRVHRVGICGTDLHAYRGAQAFFDYPRILGHELGVEVIEVGPDVEGLAPGSLCAVEPYLECGECVACRNGRSNCCTQLQVLGVHTDGGMREYVILPSEKLLPSSTLSVDQLALVEMLGIGAHAVERAQVRSGEHVLVIGAGPIGMGNMQFAVAAGAKVMAMDINEERLSFCEKSIGVDHTIDANGDAATRISELTNGEGPTVVFDATGFRGSMEKTFDYAAHGARVCFLGHTKGEITLHNPTFHKKELTLMSSRNATNSTLRKLIQLIEDGKVNTNPWITHRVSMSGLIDDFESWLKPETGVIKAMLEVC
jgi:2-desacetyl-2-hydroxyethyl bacteriochlorophyllide A dehydrogenase